MGEAKRRQTAGRPAFPASRADDLVARGKLLQHAKAHADALKLYRQALRVRPDHAEATHFCGLASIEIGQFDFGMDCLRRSLALDSRNALFQSNLGRAHLLTGAADAALECFDAAVRIDPAYAAAHFQRAGILESLGDAERSAESFLLAAATAPGNALAHAGAARQLYRLDRLPEAIACQQRAAAIDPRLLDDGVIGFALARPERAQPDARRHANAGLCQTLTSDVSAQALLQAATACELVIVDDFLADPMAHREFAMSLPFRDYDQLGNVNFPGRQTAGGHAPQDTAQRIADLLGRDLKWGWPSHGAFRISVAGSMARSDIHVDHGDDREAFGAVLYLTLPEHCIGGTSFWRHRETGWLRAPSPEEARRSRYGSFAGFMREVAAGGSKAFSDLTQGRDQWDMLFEVPMRFNRLIVYRSDYFHAIGRVFGSGLPDGRLTQLFFFEPLAKR